MKKICFPFLLGIMLLLYPSCTIEVDLDNIQDKALNPYADINWSEVNQIPSCSHEHCTVQSSLDLLISLGIKHVALSNYYPSKPYYPLEDFFLIPDDVIASPNAEHHSITPFISFHCNGLGSLFESGSFEGKTPIGMNGSDWRYTFDCILSNLQFEDGGGVTINHPHWTRWASNSPHLSVDDICQMLDYDKRVLGIEIYNGFCEHACKEHVGWDLDTWDGILNTGRKCWGFCVADHRGKEEMYSGMNILLCDSLDEHECLRAYREGRFYGSIHNTSLRFVNISLVGNSLTATATDADYISFVINGEKIDMEGCTGTVVIPDDSIYVRIEAHNAENSIYSNPIIL